MEVLFNSSDNIVKGLAVEKAILGVLKIYNPQLKVGYQLNVNDEIYKSIVFDAYIGNVINLSSFGKGNYWAKNIYIEIKAGRLTKNMLDRYLHVLLKKIIF